MTYPACEDCARPMRPRKAHVAEHPGTIRAYNGTICMSCYMIDLNSRPHINLAARQSETPFRPTFNLAMAQNTLECWLRDRRRRGVPQDGLPV
jgi:hypothetical protein